MSKITKPRRTDPTKTATDVAAIKRAAERRWPEILANVGGLQPEFLHFNQREGPCPKCAGNTRYRGLDESTGTLFCSHCFNKNNGDGIAAVGWLKGWTFPETLRQLAAYLGMNGNGKTSTSNSRVQPAKKAKLVENAKSIEPINPGLWDTLLSMYCEAKPPITPTGVRKCGGELVRGCGQRCVRFNGRDPIDSTEPSAIVLCRIDGKLFPAGKTIGERKTHTVGGSTNSWLFSDTAKEIEEAETILDVEGITDWLGVMSAGLPPGWVAVTNTAGAKAHGKLPRPWAKGKRIIVTGDADNPGQDGAKQSVAAYHQAGAAEVLWGQLPYPIEEDHGRDIRDWLLEGHKLDELPTVEVTAEEAATWVTKPAKPTHDCCIIIGTDETRVVDEAIEALATRENIYQRGGCLVHVVEGTNPPRGIARPKEAPRIAPMRFARIRELLSDAALWLQPDGKGEMNPAHPPEWVVRAIDARGQWNGIKRLEAVVESPILRADGTVLQAAGYDESTGIIFRPQGAFPAIPDKPSRADAIRARDMLLEVVEDFPFGNAAHKAACLAGTLTPLARYAFHGPSPLYLIDANVRGSGKSLLTDVTSIITAGRAMARMSLPRDDDEFRKRITALAVAGEPLILIDNIAGPFGSPSLDAALTATSWSDRILGETAMASNIPLYGTWYGTGNNVILVGDTARRVVHIRLESPEENPEERSGFRHPQLLAWVRGERSRLATAAVTILASYCAAGRPDMKLTPWGSFDEWSDLVRQAIVWCDLPDPATTRTALTSQADREAAALRQLIAGMEELDPNCTGLTVAAILEELEENQHNYATLRAALWELAPPRDGKVLNPRSIGMKLHHLRRRVIGGKFLDSRDSRGTAVWFVIGQADFGERGTKGTRGTNTGPSRAHAHTHTHGKPTATGSSPSSPISPADCPHANVVETPTHDGYVNRQCRDCGAWLPCRLLERKP